MKVEQIYTLVNTALTETLGQSELVAEDLSNLVDVGKQIDSTDNWDKIFKSLVNQIGKIIFDTRKFKGTAPSVLMDGWEYGSILEKLHVRLPESVENPSWQLRKGVSVDVNIFNPMEVDSKFFNSKTTYEVDVSYPEIQLKQSFQKASQLDALLTSMSMQIENRRELDFSNLIKRTINNFTAATLFDAYNSGTAFTTASHGRAVNLLYLYNQAAGATLTAEVALRTPEFIRYAVGIIMLYSDYLTEFSTLFNIGGQEKFTPKDLQHLILHSQFKRYADVYLQSDVFHDEFTRLPKSETMVFWQGSGTDFSFDSTSKINVTTVNPSNTAATVNVTTGGIIGVLFDRDALGVANMYNRVKSNPVPKAEFLNYYYKYDAQYFNDWNENFVVFFMA